MPYRIDARAYLYRARELLRKENEGAEALFYTAFELRACVEARQEEYATAIAHIKVKVRPWQIGKTAKQLQRIFDNKKIAHIALADGQRTNFDFYYTPVTTTLARNAEKLGDLLHRMNRFHGDDSPFWAATRLRLRNMYREAWTACHGRLLVPPLYNPKSRQLHPFTVEGKDPEFATWIKATVEDRTQIRLKVNYLETAPSAWICDLDQPASSDDPTR